MIYPQTELWVTTIESSHHRPGVKQPTLPTSAKTAAIEESMLCSESQHTRSGRLQAFTAYLTKAERRPRRRLDEALTRSVISPLWSRPSSNSSNCLLWLASTRVRIPIGYFFASHVLSRHSTGSHRLYLCILIMQRTHRQEIDTSFHRRAHT